MDYESENNLKGSKEHLENIGYDSKNDLKGSKTDLKDIDDKGIGYETKEVLEGHTEHLEGIEYEPEDNDKSVTIVASISLALLLVPKLLILGLLFIQPKLEELQGILMELSPICYIVGLVLMIVTRVKHPKNTMGKVSMWFYIIITVIEVIIGILAILLVVWLCGACIEVLPECGKMG